MCITRIDASEERNLSVYWLNSRFLYTGLMSPGSRGICCAEHGEALKEIGERLGDGPGASDTHTRNPQPDNGKAHCHTMIVMRVDLSRASPAAGNRHAVGVFIDCDA